MKTLKITTIIVLCLCMLIGCDAPNATTYKNIKQGTSLEQIAKIIGEEPTKIQEENGTTCYLYENSKYADYTGTATYYCAEDQVMMSRWAYDVDENEDRGDVYNDILATLEKEYGTFTKGGNDVTYTLQTEEKLITLASFPIEGGYNIVITCN